MRALSTLFSLMFLTAASAQICCPDDVTPPALTSDLDPTVIICDGVVPEIPELDFTDDCAVQRVHYSDTQMRSDGETICQLGGLPQEFIGYIGNFWIMIDGVQHRFYYEEGQGEMVISNTGAYIHGIVAHSDNPEWRLVVHVFLSAAYDWDTWSNMMTTMAPYVNRTYKDPSGWAEANGAFEDWEYYDVLDNSYVVGLDGLSGTFLSLSHMPVHHFYGFQKGVSCANTNSPYLEESYGAWMGAQGIFNEVHFDGVIDIAGSLICSEDVPSADLPVINREWYAVDPCTNFNKVEQNIYVVDEPAEPGEVIFLGAEDVVEYPCYFDLPSQADPVVAVRDCQEIDIQREETLSGDLCSGFTLARNYTALNSDGSQANYSRILSTPADTEPPVILEFSSSAVVTCPPIVDAEFPVEVSEPCNSYEISYSDDEEIQPPCITYFMTRTYIATDACGNVSDPVERNFGVYGAAPPDFDFVPEDLAISCTDDLPTDLAEASDNCGLESVSYSDEVSEDACETLITRTHLAIDNCGIDAEAVQLITVYDDETPLILSFPEDEVYSCAFDDISPPETLTVSDNCDQEPLVDVVETDTGEGCDRVIERVYTVMDDCGNAIIQSQFITFDASIVGLDESSLEQIEIFWSNDATLVFSYPSSGVPSDAIVSVFDVKGRLLVKEILSPSIELRAANTGLYLIHIVSDEEIIMKSVVKQ